MHALMAVKIQHVNGRKGSILPAKAAAYTASMKTSMLS
jgi:hypothetical protein